MDYHGTKYGKFSLKAMNTKMWNDLPDEVKNKLTLVFYSSKDKLRWPYTLTSEKNSNFLFPPNLKGIEVVF